MKIQTFKRLTPEDAKPEDREIINKIADSLNVFADDLQNLVNNKNVSITDNLNMQWIDITVVVDSTGYATNPQKVQFKSSLNGRCRGISVERVDNLSNSNGFLTSAPFIQWNESGGIITINHFNGLSAATKYSITLLAKG